MFGEPKLDHTWQFGHSDDHNHSAHRSADRVVRQCKSVVRRFVAADCRADVWRNHHQCAAESEGEAAERAVWVRTFRRSGLPSCVRWIREHWRGRWRNATWHLHDNCNRYVGKPNSFDEGHAEGAITE